MIPGLSGPLLSHDAIHSILGSAVIPDLPPEAPAAIVRQLRAWHAVVRSRLGPACSARTVFDLVAEPLAAALGYRVVPVAGNSEHVEATLQVRETRAAVMIVTAWGQPAASVWRLAVHRALDQGTRWCLCVSGPAIRAVRRRSCVRAPLCGVRSSSHRRQRPGARAPVGAASGDGLSAGGWRSGARPGRRLLRTAPGGCSLVAAGWRARRARAARHRVPRSDLQAPCGWRRARRIAHRHLSRPVSVVRGGPRAGSVVAPRLSRRLHDRGAAPPAPRSSDAAWTLGSAPGDLTSRAAWMPGGDVARAAFQRAAVLPGERAARRQHSARRSRRLPRARRADDAEGTTRDPNPFPTRISASSSSAPSTSICSTTTSQAAPPHPRRWSRPAGARRRDPSTRRER